ncbi:MAG: DUF4337 domain-containing protein [Planctomycetes bacterium]|nr:DUF4337 domain-containing protein [Planctomycetota bacterium]
MSHGPEHHIEHAEHAQHAAHDPFDKRVTVSIAVIAAVLAAVTMLGHRAHNETLKLQGEALRNQTEAGISHSKAANMWALFQAQNIRGHMYLSLARLLEVSSTAQGSEDAKNKAITEWKDKRDRYEKHELPKWEKEAKGLTANAEERELEAQKALQESHEIHARGNRFDLGELGLQLGVVLCSMAILTKSRNFWYAGLACSALGILVALTGVFGLFIAHH